MCGAWEHAFHNIVRDFASETGVVGCGEVLEAIVDGISMWGLIARCGDFAVLVNSGSDAGVYGVHGVVDSFMVL